MRFRWLAVGAVLGACHAHAEEAMKPAAVFSRCYGQLTTSQISRGSDAYRAVAQGSVDPIDSCFRVLAGTELSAASANEGRLTRENAETLSVLRTFNHLHRTWFPRDDAVVSLQNSLAERTNELHDTSEAGLHLTRALLSPSVPFSEVVTGASAMEALRTDGAEENLSREPARRFTTASSQSDRPYPSEAPIDVALVQKGELWGVRPLARNPRKANAKAQFWSPSYPGQQPIHRTEGGGILGTQSYLLMNLGLNHRATADGGLVLPREFAKSVLKDFLCRDLPAIRVSDAVLYTPSTVSASAPPFRRSATCMSCHVTMDPLASLARNLTFVFLPRPKASDPMPGLIAGHLYHWSPTLPAQLGTVDRDPEFHRRPATGKLTFRNYKGDLVNRSVTGIAELGRVLSEQEDLYVCAASRYLEYFTGISVALSDPGDPALEPLTNAQREYRQIAVDLGLELKRHQSLRTLVRQILSLPLYRQSGMRNLRN